MILGLRSVERRRYGSPTPALGHRVRPPPTVETVQASVDFAPAEDWEIDPSGERARRVIEIVSWVDWRSASSQDDWYADEVVVDGRVYQVHAAHYEEPFEGSRRGHYEARAVEVM